MIKNILLCLFFPFFVLGCTNNRRMEDSSLVESWPKDSLRADSAMRVYFKHSRWKDDSLIKAIIVRVSEKQFWQRQETLDNCIGRSGDIAKMELKASDSLNIFWVMLPTMVHQEYDPFYKRIVSDTSQPSIDLFLDRDCRVMELDCDSGIVYKKY